jgi:hypothetical protein
MQDVPATIVIASRPDNRTTRFFANNCIFALRPERQLSLHLHVIDRLRYSDCKRQPGCNHSCVRREARTICQTRTEQAMTRIIRKMIGILLAVAITATVGTAAENHGSKKRIHYG